MSVPQAACLAIAVLLIEFPVSNGFTLMRNTGMQPGGGRRRRRRKKCMPPMRTRDRRARLYYVATIFDNQVFPSFLILLSRLLYSCNTVQFKLGKRAINLVTIYLFKTPFDIYPIETLPLPFGLPFVYNEFGSRAKIPHFFNYRITIVQSFPLFSKSSYVYYYP